MHTQTFIILTLFLIHLVLGDEQALERDQEIHLLIKGKRNYTGHLITEVHFSEEPSKIGDHWKIDLKQGMSETRGRKIFQLKATITDSPEVPKDYILFPGIGYYKFHWNISKIFLDALSTCKNEGGHLLIINSEDEAVVVKNLFSSYKPENPKAYAGFSDPLMGQNFITVFGQPLNETGYQKWGKDQPNGRNNESCGYVYVDGTLGDVVCTSPLPFICEFDLSWNAV